MVHPGPQGGDRLPLGKCSGTQDSSPSAPQSLEFPEECGAPVPMVMRLPLLPCPRTEPRAPASQMESIELVFQTRSFREFHLEFIFVYDVRFEI